MECLNLAETLFYERIVEINLDLLIKPEAISHIDISFKSCFGFERKMVDAIAIPNVRQYSPGSSLTNPYISTLLTDLNALSNQMFF